MLFGEGAHFYLGVPLVRPEAMTVLPMLFDRTSWFEASDVGPWLPSVLARRYEYLQLAVDLPSQGLAASAQNWRCSTGW